MRTDDLIGQLSANLEPVKRGAIGRLLLGTILIGMIGSAVVMLGTAALGTSPAFADGCEWVLEKAVAYKDGDFFMCNYQIVEICYNGSGCITSVRLIDSWVDEC